MTTRWVIWSDVHIPFANPVATELTLRFLDWYKPNVAILAGDLLDFYMLSSFDRDPRRRMTIDQDLAAGNAYLDEVDRVLPADCEKVFVEGNHDDRLRRFLWHRAPELVPLPGSTVPGLLRLHERDWQYIPYNGEQGLGWALGGFLVIHGWAVWQAIGCAARGCLQKLGLSEVLGHAYWLAHYRQRMYDGVRQWLECGCLCSLQLQYAPLPDWQQSFVVETVGPAGAHVTPVEIGPEWVTLSGKVWAAR